MGGRKQLLIPVETQKKPILYNQAPPWKDRVESHWEPLTSQLVRTTGMRLGRFLSLVADSPSDESLELCCP